jgi:hypothetical protein
MVSGVSVQVSGFWSLATGHWLLARSEKPAASSQNADTLLRGRIRYTRQRPDT